MPTLRLLNAHARLARAPLLRRHQMRLTNRVKLHLTTVPVEAIATRAFGRSARGARGGSAPLIRGGSTRPVRMPSELPREQTGYLLPVCIPQGRGQNPTRLSARDDLPLALFLSGHPHITRFLFFLDAYFTIKPAAARNPQYRVGPSGCTGCMHRSSNARASELSSPRCPPPQPKSPLPSESCVRSNAPRRFPAIEGRCACDRRVLSEKVRTRSRIRKGGPARHHVDPDTPTARRPGKYPYLFARLRYPLLFVEICL